MSYKQKLSNIWNNWLKKSPKIFVHIQQSLIKQIKELAKLSYKNFQCGNRLHQK